MKEGGKKMKVRCNSVNEKCKKTLCPHQEDHEAEFGLHCFKKGEVCDFSPTGKAECIEAKNESCGRK